MRYPAKGISDNRVVFDERWLNARRHIVAGPTNLYQDLIGLGDDVVEMFLSSPVADFGRFIDSATYNADMIKHPAFVRVLTWLYYDPKEVGHLRKKLRVSTIRQVTRVVNQYKRTWDFFRAEDAQIIWDKLPEQFNSMKIGSNHLETK